MAWEYYENDGAFFRKRKNSAGFSVDDVWTGAAWVPYKGDRLKPYCFGNKIGAADQPDGASRRSASIWCRRGSRRQNVTYEDNR